MSAINFHTKEISVKIVYYGAGLCGKTTSLQTVYRSIPEDRRPQIVSLATEVDRTIFFDYLPVTAYRIRDFNVRLQLYTVPGQVFYNATRKLVLNGVDGIVFVVDSQKAMKDSNLESLRNLEENLIELGLEPDRIPLVMQYNKRDLDDLYTVEEMERVYNTRKLPHFATVATTGKGLLEVIKAITRLVVGDLIRKGLGRQIREQSANGSAAEGEASSQSKPGAGPTMSSTVAEAVSRVAAPASAPGGIDLWPSGEAARLGGRIEGALLAERWSEVASVCYELLTGEAHRWATSDSHSSDDPLPAFLLLRGVAGPRYKRLRQAMEGLRAGRNVGRPEAMNALILALEALW